MSDVFKAIADPTRRRILELLRERPMSAGELAEHFVLSKPTMSGHFAVLKGADLVQADKSGTTITYHINTSVLEGALLTMMKAFGFPLTENDYANPNRRKSGARHRSLDAISRRVGVVRRS